MTHGIAADVAPEDAWFKSSYSEANGTGCVEIAHLPHTAQVGIRDSKDKGGPALVVPAGAWAEFIAAVRKV
ncbi:DUF397 domain-containing protein [Streptomyces samsunensis]|uniref:DUF397 domain-containing protein n=1 Tax=Streptomyces malaysiensis TaxID=92644 RepID=A0A2J7YU27_STRMQ|nr:MULTISPECIES: DUF397 domain-containing protein [Streptomyces]NUH40953.1 DUF397 domain-containing protein [Streptomyces samsunensis]PNG91524.1 hypothetical protein SMF913_26989 [Streptomyces malaysiensis]